MAKLLVYLKDAFVLCILCFATVNSIPLVRYSKPTNAMFEAVVSNPLFGNNLSF